MDLSVYPLWRNWRSTLAMGGKPGIRNMRVTVGMIAGQIGAGHAIEELLADYPYFEREDILQALRYAACARIPGPQCVTNVTAPGGREFRHFVTAAST